MSGETAKTSLMEDDGRAIRQTGDSDDHSVHPGRSGRLAAGYRTCGTSDPHGNGTLVVAGTTGESPTLTHEEKLELFRRVSRQADGRVKVIAGTGSNNTEASIRLTKEAEEAGVDGVMLVGPYYNKPSQEGLFRHFQAIAEATSLPVMLYNVPGRTGMNISVDTMVRLAEMDNVVAIKEASGDLSQVTELTSRVPDRVAVYSGDDKSAVARPGGGRGGGRQRGQPSGRIPIEGDDGRLFCRRRAAGGPDSPGVPSAV